MSTGCLFGIFVFRSKFALIYRFLTDDLYEYLHKRFMEKARENQTENNEENQEIAYSIDDFILMHFSTLISFYEQTLYRHCPIRQITLESNIQAFFDQIGKNCIICMADQSFNTIVVLKTINLFKSLIKFHIGALPLTKSKTVGKLIDQISASLQYYLNNITTNQALLFESCEYLHFIPSIRPQCIEACTTLNQDIQLWLHVQPTITLIKSKDKIVYMHINKTQNRPSNSDLFLLILNDTSRSLRNQFKSQQNNLSNKMAHIYTTKNNNQTVTHSARTSMIDNSIQQNQRKYSLPIISQSESIETNDNCCIEVIFMKTSNKVLAPFTMYTILLPNDISAIILIEWKNSLACSQLSELIGLLDLYTNSLGFSYNKLNDQVKLIENNAIIRQCFENIKISSKKLSNLLNEIKIIHKTLPKTTVFIDEDDPKGNQIAMKLKEMSDDSIDTFRHLIFDSDEYTLLNKNDQQTDLPINENILLEISMLQKLQNKLLIQLKYCFSFLETQSQLGIPMSFCGNEFPGLVHFALIDRLHGHICTAPLHISDYEHYLTTNNNINEMRHFVEKKILAFELECLAALQRGCTSYTMTDEHFIYNYTLRLQESNGASMRLHKSFVESQPPGVLYFDFYKALAHENYRSLVDQTTIGCFELICVHLRFVPSSIVREQCEQLWPKLMELK